MKLYKIFDRIFDLSSPLWGPSRVMYQTSHHLGGENEFWLSWAKASDHFSQLRPWSLLSHFSISNFMVFPTSKLYEKTHTSFATLPRKRSRGSASSIGDWAFCRHTVCFATYCFQAQDLEVDRHCRVVLANNLALIEDFLSASVLQRPRHTWPFRTPEGSG